MPRPESVGLLKRQTSKPVSNEAYEAFRNSRYRRVPAIHFALQGLRLRASRAHGRSFLLTVCKASDRATWHGCGPAAHPPSLPGMRCFGTNAFQCGIPCGRSAAGSSGRGLPTLVSQGSEKGVRVLRVLAWIGQNPARKAFRALPYVQIMNKTLKPYAVVRVLTLVRQADDYDGWRVNKRTPAVGDVGTLIDVLAAPGLADRYVVESSDGNGTTVWLGDFLADELEVVQTA